MTVHGSISPDRGLKCVLVKNTCIQEQDTHCSCRPGPEDSYIPSIPRKHLYTQYKQGYEYWFDPIVLYRHCSAPPRFTTTAMSHCSMTLTIYFMHSASTACIFAFPLLVTQYTSYPYYICTHSITYRHHTMQALPTNSHIELFTTLGRGLISPGLWASLEYQFGYFIMHTIPTAHYTVTVLLQTSSLVRNKILGPLNSLKCNRQ